MKSIHLILTKLSSLSCLLVATGCVNHEYSQTSPYHPGPVAGQAVGNVAGVVAGNAVGFGVGVVHGTVEGAVAPFDNHYHLVRHWATETTSDGRVIQVPIDILVDKYGRPVGFPPPTGNSSVAPALPPGN